jgi:hypothetical protein
MIKNVKVFGKKMFEIIKKILNKKQNEPVMPDAKPLPEKTLFEKAKESGAFAFNDFNASLTNEQQDKYLKYSFQARTFVKRGNKFDATGVNFAKDQAIDVNPLGNDLCGLHGVANEVVFTFFAKQGFIGWQLAGLLAQHWLINNSCSIPNEDAVRNGWELSLTENNEQSKEINSFIKKKYDLKNKLIKFGRNRKIFGIGIAIPVYKDNIDIDFEKPFNIDSIKPNSLETINIIDPYWCFPEFSDSGLSNPVKSDFYSPTHYRIYNKRVHVSHLCIWKNEEPVDILKPSYYFGGIPLPQLLLERVYSEEASANESLELLRTKRTYVEKTDDMKGLFLNFDKALSRLLRLTKTRNNHGVWFTENEAKLLETNLGGLSEILTKHCELVSAIAKIPIHKLFKIRSAGSLGNKDEVQVDYDQELEDLQVSGMTNFLNHFYGIALASEYVYKKNFEIEFNSPKATDGEYENEAELKRVQSIDMLVSSGIITPLEARKCIADEKLLGLNIEVENSELETSEDPELQEALDEFIEAEHKRDENGRFATMEGASKSDILLNVPYDNKDEAKALGARWNPDLKKWYIPSGKDVQAFSKWERSYIPQLFNAIPVEEKQIEKPKRQVLQELKDGFKVVGETKKAYLIENAEGKDFWIKKMWVRKDGSLTPAAIKAHEETLTAGGVSENKEKAKKAEQEHIFRLIRDGVKINKTWESETAIATDINFDLYNLEEDFSVRIFVPKSILNEKGNAPYDYVKRKAEEAQAKADYRSRGGYAYIDGLEDYFGESEY